MKKLFPEIKPFREGYLKVSPIHTLHYEEVGNPNGKPLIFLHGGPGVGIIPEYRRFFDPKFYRIILLDQRGSGKSTPFAELKENTTQHLVEDLEKLKKYLGIEKWLVTGGSWGSTLALCYSISYPKSVEGIIIRGICLGRKWELDWLFGENGAAKIWPDKWEEFTSLIPKSEMKNIPEFFYKKLQSKESEKFAKLWSDWEGTIMSIYPEKTKHKLGNKNIDMSFSKIESYYTINNFFMPYDNYILDNVGKISNIPLFIIQGRYDTICPAQSAYDLHKALPKSKLILVPLGSHSPLDKEMINEIVSAGENFKKLYKK